MFLLRIFTLAALSAHSALLAEASMDATTACDQDEALFVQGTSAVLLLQQEMRLQSRDRVAVAVDREGLVGPAEGLASAQESQAVDERAAAGAQVQVSYKAEPALGDSELFAAALSGAAPDDAVAVDAGAVDAAADLAAAGDPAQQQHREADGDAAASAVRVEELPMASFSLLETSHGAGAVARSHGAVGKTGTLLSTQSAGVVSFILIISFVLLVAVMLTCLLATVPGSQDKAQAQRLLQGAQTLKQAGEPQQFGSGPLSGSSMPFHKEFNELQQAKASSPQRQTSSPQRKASGPGSAASLRPATALRASGSPPTEARAAQLGGPPPICPTLILPHTEARFMVAMDGLTQMTAGQLDILGTSGRKLLSATLATVDGRRSCAISSVGAEDDPRAKAVMSGSGVGLEVFGPQGDFYGTIQNMPSGATCLACGDKTVMAIECSNRADLVITACTPDGRVLATAGRNVAPGRGGGGGGDFWRLQVKADVDAVLVATCMLSRILLLPWQ